MIKFFRKIRQRLLTENKFSKYLLYALGEIVLVMIGILLALQVGQWNNNRNDRQQEQKVLSQLKTEFRTNLEQINDKIKMRALLLESGYRILEMVDDPDKIPPEKEFNNIIGLTLPAPTFDPTNGVTNDLINSGKLYLIQNDSLRQLISGWSGDIDFATEEEWIWKDHRDREYIPFLKKNFNSRNFMNAVIENTELMKIIDFDKTMSEQASFGYSRKESDIASLLKTTDIEDHIADMLLFNTVAQRQTAGLRNKAENILEMIDSEIQNNP